MSAQLPRQEAPPSTNPAAWFEANRRGSGFDRVAALSVLALGGGHGQPHFLADSARQEPTNGMRLPAGDFHQLLGGDAARSFEQIQNPRGFAAVGLLRALGRFLGRSGLPGRLALLLRNVPAVWRDTGLFGGLRLGGFRLLARRRGVADVFFC